MDKGEVMQYQKCPICDGRGQVSGGYFDSPGYVDEQGNRRWTSGHAAEACRVCQGQGIIKESSQEVVKE